MPKVKIQASSNNFADPEHDPAPIGRDYINEADWCEKIDQLVANESYVHARLLAMRYAAAVCRAMGVMEPTDSEMRKRGYRFFQVTEHNWSEVIEKHGFRVPEVPGALSVEMQSALKSKAPDFVIHSPDVKYPTREITPVMELDGSEPRNQESKEAVFLDEPEDGPTFTTNVTQPPVSSEIAKRRSQLPPR